MSRAGTIDRIARCGLSALLVLVAGCQGEQEAPDQTGPAPGVRITAPEDGAEAAGSSVEVMLAVEGLDVVPAGTQQANSGHHHLFIDTDLTPVGEPIPADQEGIIHMGDASTSYTLSDLAPGEHRIIAVIGDHLHVRLPVATDTVTVVVR